VPVPSVPALLAHEVLRLTNQPSGHGYRTLPVVGLIRAAGMHERCCNG
jgi:hypothetical protein